MSETLPARRPVVTIPGPPPADAEGLLTVRILRAPLRLWERASEHTADLLRDFALLQVGAAHGSSHHLPERLLRLVAELEQRYAGTSEEQTRRRREALDAGLLSLDLEYQVPAAVGEACATLADLLDEADAFCDEGVELMTLSAPADQREFRQWYLGEFVRQVAGEQPLAWPGSLD